MPKDAKKNVDRYKVAGGHLNEFEFHQNQGQVKEAASPAKSSGGEKSTKAGRSATTKGATAKKLAAKKAARK